MLVTGPGFAQTIDPTSLLRIEKGDLPVLIVAGHGGNKPLPGAAPRRREQSNDPKFMPYADLKTLELAAELAAVLIHEYGGKHRPSLIISTVHRRCCDLNRKLELSSQDPLARAYHQAYHQAIRQELARIKEAHGWALLLDIHGQTHFDTALMLGTAEHTVISDWSKKAIWGPGGLIVTLEQLGYSIEPRLQEGKQVYAGGFTIREHGKDLGVEAWQLEHNSELRLSDNKRLRYVHALAKFLVKALSTYPKNG